MTILLKIGFVILVLVTYSQGVEFYVLSRWTSGSCPSRDNCQLMGNMTFEERNCECDRLCSSFQDCCVDAPNSRPLFTSLNSTCMSYGNDSNLGVYAVSSCPTDFSGPKQVKDFCEGQDDFRNLLFSTPVTDILSHVTFLNRYCAKCHKDDDPSLKSWVLSMKFENLPKHCHNVEFVKKYLNFNPVLKKWGIQTASYFYPMISAFYKPDYIPSVRQCRVNLITSCPTDWNKIEVKKACRLYTSVVHTLERSYKNIQCAICNGEKPFDLSCTKRPGNTVIQDLPLTYEMKVDFNLMENITEEILRMYDLTL